MADILGKERNQIVITLKCDESKNHNFTISNPKSDVSEEEIKAIAELLMEVCEPMQHGSYVEIVKGKVVASETDVFDLQ